ncbi:hypothetical protein [Amycolatopsis sp. NPDC021455]|uniref:hypothetical protein n=1 Tax=Amycolatopsis sp. NPDC021455 TaxID=3154901 RepID=UPI0033CCC556
MTGLADVVAALAEATVDTLVIGDPADTPVWLGNNPGELPTDAKACGLPVSTVAASTRLTKSCLSGPGDRGR